MKMTASGVLALAAVAGVGYVGFKLMNVNLNPADSENVVNKAVTDAVGEDRIATAADYIFGYYDLINPFNESDAHAHSVYGIDRLLNANAQSWSP